MRSLFFAGLFCLIGSQCLAQSPGGGGSNPDPDDPSSFTQADAAFYRTTSEDEKNAALAIRSEVVTEEIFYQLARGAAISAGVPMSQITPLDDRVSAAMATLTQGDQKITSGEALFAAGDTHFYNHADPTPPPGWSDGGVDRYYRWYAACQDYYWAYVNFNSARAIFLTALVEVTYCSNEMSQLANGGGPGGL